MYVCTFTNTEFRNLDQSETKEWVLRTIHMIGSTFKFWIGGVMNNFFHFCETALLPDIPFFGLGSLIVI